MNRDLGGLMQLSIPFTILNKKFNEMDMIRKIMKNEEFWEKNVEKIQLIINAKFIVVDRLSSKFPSKFNSFKQIYLLLR